MQRARYTSLALYHKRACERFDPFKVHFTLDNSVAAISCMIMTEIPEMCGQEVGVASVHTTDKTSDLHFTPI